jgi:transcriptional regulator with XRE-family HTH domain
LREVLSMCRVEPQMRKQKLYEDELLEALAAVVKGGRDVLGLSQAGMAEKTGLARSYIGDFERGARPISLKNVSRLAQALGLSASKLLALAERRVKEVHESE